MHLLYNCWVQSTLPRGGESHRWCASWPKPLAVRCHIHREHVNTWHSCESFRRCYIHLESYSFGGDSFSFWASGINSSLIFTPDIPKIAIISWSNLSWKRVMFPYFPYSPPYLKMISIPTGTCCRGTRRSGEYQPCVCAIMEFSGLYLCSFPHFNKCH